MSETVVKLGYVPKNRGEYNSSERYYNDNIVQYNGSSYIAHPTAQHNQGNAGTSEDPVYYLTSAPTDNSTPPQLTDGWEVFASGNNKFVTGQSVDQLSVDSTPTAGHTTSLITSAGVSGAVASSNAKVGYYECATEGSTADKVVSASDYVVSTGGSFKIKMATKNTAASGVTLNINSTGAKALYYDGEPVTNTNTWDAEEVVDVYYDGTRYYANNVSGGGKFLTGEKVREVGIDPTPTAGSTNLVESGGVNSSLHYRYAEKELIANLSTTQVVFDDNTLSYGNIVAVRVISNTAVLSGRLHCTIYDETDSREAPIADDIWNVLIAETDITRLRVAALPNTVTTGGIVKIEVIYQELSGAAILEKLLNGNLAFKSILQNSYIGTANKITYNAGDYQSLCSSVINGLRYGLINNNESVSYQYYLFTKDINGQVPVGDRIACTKGEVVVTAPEGANFLFMTAVFNGNGSVNNCDIYEATKKLAGIDESISSLFNEKENASNKVSEFSTAPTNTNYPSEKLVYDSLQEIDAKTKPIDKVIVTIKAKNLYNYSVVGVNSGGIIATNGSVITSIVGFYTGLIPIKPNTYYYLSNRSNSSNSNSRALKENGLEANRMKLIAVNGETRSNYEFPNADASGVTRNGPFKTPADAAYVQFNISPNDATELGDYYKIMLEEIGAEYDPNFIPSEWDDGEDDYKIENDAIEKDSEVTENSKLPVESGAVFDAIAAASPEKKIKVLLVGSSHGMNTIAQFPWICYNSTNKLNVEVGNVYIGSFSLQRLVGMNERNETCTLKYFKDGAWTSYSGKSFAQVFSYTDWDFISVQRSASDDELWLATQNEADSVQNDMTNINYNTQLAAVYMSHNDALQYVLNLIRSNVTKNSEIIFNSGFADPSEGNASSDSGVEPTISQTASIISTAKDMKAQFGIDYVPVAIAIRNARNTFMRYIGKYDAGSDPSYKKNRSNELCYDSQHLDYGIGCYVASMCLLEFICRKVGWDTINLDGFGTQEELLTFISVATPENYTMPTEETMMVAKACAKCACDNPDSVSTKLQNRFKWKITYNLASGITASNSKGYSTDTDKYETTFTGTVSSVTVKSRGWNRGDSQTTLTLNTDYTYDSSTQTLTILSVEGDIEIIVS